MSVCDSTEKNQLHENRERKKEREKMSVELFLVLRPAVYCHFMFTTNGDRRLKKVCQMKEYNKKKITQHTTTKHRELGKS